MKVTIKNWHAVASWTWTTEDDVCGICHMPLDGCAPGAAGPGDDSPVVWGRVRLRHCHMPFFSLLTCHGSLMRRPCLAAVLTLLSPDVHHDVAAQQEHVPGLPSQVGVCLRAQACACNPGRPEPW